MSLLDKVRSLLSGGKLDVERRFEILREATAGTMSQFYVVREHRTGTIQGLKILDPEKTELFEARFKGLDKPSEGEIAVSLQHPRIVRTWEHGLTTTGRNYLLMEFLEGAGLNTLIFKRDPLLDGRRMTLIRQMIEAVGAVHSAGFIHRDICPRNYICSPDGSSLKLIDFGLTIPATRPFMLPGNRTGTPNYMAPEVVRRKNTDLRVDIFALGVTIYQLCALELPWPSRETSGKVAMLHDTQEPVDILSIRPGLNRTLADVVRRCLAVDPARRPDDTQQLLRMLSDVEHENEP